MSKIGTICELIQGAHVASSDGLHDYHVAREVINGAHCRSLSKRFSAIRLALHPYRVMVSIDGDTVRIYRPDTQSEVRL